MPHPEHQPTTPPHVRLAHRFLEGKITEGALVSVDLPDKRITTVGSYKVEGLTPGVVQIAYLEMKQVPVVGSESEDRDRLNKLEFQYTKRPMSGSTQGAELVWDVANPQEFRLSHRFVDPESRRDGVGSKLLQHTHEFFQAIADQSQQPVLLTLDVGQRSVMGWLEKNGYQVVPEQAQELVEVKTQPERFVEDVATQQQQDPQRDPYLFRVGVEARDKHSAVRLTFTKKLLPKKH